MAQAMKTCNFFFFFLVIERLQSCLEEYCIQSYAVSCLLKFVEYSRQRSSASLFLCQFFGVLKFLQLQNLLSLWFPRKVPNFIPKQVAKGCVGSHHAFIQLSISFCSFRYMLNYRGVPLEQKQEPTFEQRTNRERT